MDTSGFPKAFQQFLAELHSQPQETHFLELDREKELQYCISFTYRFARVLSGIPMTDASLRILDIGTTPFTLFLKKAFPHYEICTLDYTHLFHERCDRFRIPFRIADLSHDRIPYGSKQFDAVIFTEVLEHLIRPPLEILSEMYRILSPTGILLLSVPNIASLKNRALLLLGRQIMHSADSQLTTGVHGYGHIHEYTRKEIVGLCHKSGFTVNHIEMLAEPRTQVFRALNTRNAFIQVVRSLLYFLPTLRHTILLQCSKPFEH